MTIHAAKGLEFPVVVLGDVTHASHASGRRLVVDRQWGVVLGLQDVDGNRPAVSLAASALVASREAAEDRRLLYVAATRAREKLVLNGYVKQARDGSFVTSASWLEALGLDLSHLHTTYNPEGGQCLRQELYAGDTSIGCSVFEPNLPKATTGGKTAPAAPSPVRDVVLPPPLLAVIPGQVDAVDEPSPAGLDTSELKVWRVVPEVQRPSAPRWVVGSLVHEALAQWRFPDAGFAGWVDARARSYGLTDNTQLADCRARVRRMLVRFQGHELCHRIGRSDEHRHEVPYTHILPDSGLVDSGRIDCLFRNENDWTVVDFKTDYVSSQVDPVQWVSGQGYLQQLRRYVEAVEKLWSCSPRACICLLDFGGKVHLVYN